VRTPRRSAEPMRGHDRAPARATHAAARQLSRLRLPPLCVLGLSACLHVLCPTLPLPLPLSLVAVLCARTGACLA
jgi:hypothetical protein